MALDPANHRLAISDTDLEHIGTGATLLVRFAPGYYPLGATNVETGMNAADRTKETRTVEVTATHQQRLGTLTDAHAHQAGYANAAEHRAALEVHRGSTLPDLMAVTLLEFTHLAP